MKTKLFIILFFASLNYASSRNTFEETRLSFHNSTHCKQYPDMYINSASENFVEGMIRFNPYLTPCEAWELKKILFKTLHLCNREIEYCSGLKSIIYNDIYNLTRNLYPHLLDTHDLEQSYNLNQSNNFVQFSDQQLSNQQFLDHMFRITIATLQALFPKNCKVIEEQLKIFKKEKHKNLMSLITDENQIMAQSQSSEPCLQKPESFPSFYLSHPQPLFEAIKKGDLESVKHALTHGTPIDTVDFLGASLLNTAIKYNQKEIIDYLLEHGVNVNVPDKTGYLPVLIAAINSNIPILETLEKKGADVYKRSGYDDNDPLFIAHEQEDESLVYFLDKPKRDYNRIMQLGSKEFIIGTLLFNPYLTTPETWELISHFTIDSSFFNKKIHYGEKMRCSAYHVPHIISQTLYKNTSSVSNSQQYYQNEFRIKLAMVQSLLPHNPEIIEELLKFYKESRQECHSYLIAPEYQIMAQSQSPEPCLQKPESFPSFYLSHPQPLFEAIKKGDLESVKHALTHGTPIDTVDFLGVSLLNTAIKYNQKEIIDYLLEHDVEVNAPDKTHFLPILVATIHDNIPVMKKLIAKKALIHVSSGPKYIKLSPFDIAQKQNNISLQRFLYSKIQNLKKIDTRIYGQTQNIIKTKEFKRSNIKNTKQR